MPTLGSPRPSPRLPARHRLHPIPSAHWTSELPGVLFSLAPPPALARLPAARCLLDPRPPAVLLPWPSGSCLSGPPPDSRGPTPRGSSEAPQVGIRAVPGCHRLGRLSARLLPLTPWLARSPSLLLCSFSPLGSPTALIIRASAAFGPVSWSRGSLPWPPPWSLRGATRMGPRPPVMALPPPRRPAALSRGLPLGPLTSPLPVGKGASPPPLRCRTPVPLASRLRAGPPPCALPLRTQSARTAPTVTPAPSPRPRRHWMRGPLLTTLAPHYPPRSALGCLPPPWRPASASPAGPGVFGAPRPSPFPLAPRVGALLLLSQKSSTVGT